MENVYMDHAAATPVNREVVDAMLPYFDREFANPSTVYEMGSRVRQVVEEQRAKVASLIGASPEGIIFTSSGAEANNLAIKGVAFAKQKKGNHIIVSAIEHHSVLNSARFLERMGFEASFLPVDEYGLVSPGRLMEAIRPETVLVSIMHANNEIGTIEPIYELSLVCREKGVMFHTDAVATVGNIPVKVDDLGVDLLSLSGVSMGAPKGIGALYFRERTRLMPLIHGGIQESGRRAGTENVPAIVGLGKASVLAAERLGSSEDSLRIQEMRNALVLGVQEHIEHSKYTGHPGKRLPGHASFCFEAIEGESLIFMLSQGGIYANTGSACASKALKTSPVLVAIGIPTAMAQGSIVFTMNNTNRSEEVEYVLEKLLQAVGKLRSFSPIWKEKQAA